MNRTASGGSASGESSGFVGSQPQFWRMGTRLIAFGLFLVAGCSGGGGGEGGGDGRTTDTGVRVLHAGLDLAPLSVNAAGVVIGASRYLEPPASYTEIPVGPTLVNADQANSPGSGLLSLTLNAQEKTEYTVVLSGRLQDNTFAATIMEEPVERPEKGTGRIRFLHLLEDSSALSASAGGTTLGPVAYRTATNYVTVPMGPYDFQITDSSGAPVSQVHVELPDRGEAWIVTAGLRPVGAVFSRVLQDLD